MSIGLSSFTPALPFPFSLTPFTAPLKLQGNPVNEFPSVSFLAAYQMTHNVLQRLHRGGMHHHEQVHASKQKRQRRGHFPQGTPKLAGLPLGGHLQPCFTRRPSI